MVLWFGSKNAHKVGEVGEILGSGFQLKSLLDLPDFPDVEEDGATYLENARLKARSIWNHVKAPVFADDSGLEVDALAGRPGIHSSRYSAPNPTPQKNIDKLLGELGTLPPEKRTARFRCTIVFIDAGGKEHVFEGILEGWIGFERRGTEGFGFDPVFVVSGRKETVAELPADEKNRISHRGLAVQHLHDFLKRTINKSE